MADRDAINAPARTTRFEVELELDGGEVQGWKEIQLPEVSTEEVSYREGNEQVAYDHPLWGRHEYSNLTMIRGAKTGETMLWDWRQKVIDGNIDEARKDIAVTIFDVANSASLLRYEFEGAWPVNYSPPTLDASAVGGESALAEEEIEIAYEKYERTA